MFTIQAATADGRAIVRCAGELDVSVCRGLLEAVERALGSDADELCVDLSDIAFADSSGLSSLVMLESLTRGLRARLRIMPSEPVRRPFALAGATIDFGDGGAR